VDNCEGIKRGVFYAHTGLARQALEFEFGEKWMDYFKDQSKEEFAIEPR
jgi:hypothetical protein